MNGFEEMKSEVANERPLDGILVLDFTSIVAGPYCTRLLSDLGAKVIKVESADGDNYRVRPPMRGKYSNMFGHLNAGKDCIVLDLKSQAGIEAALELASKVDVVVENWRPGVAKRLGLGYESISKINEGVVFCSISGFGQEGPSAHRSAYAPIVHAASGFDMALIEGKSPSEAPAVTSIFIADMLAGISAFGAIQTALFRRERTGNGQFIDVALMDCIMSIMVHECQTVQASSGIRERVFRPLRTRDGFIVVAPNTQKNFKQMTVATNQPELLEDLRFSTSKARGSNWSSLMDIVEVWTKSRLTSECEEILLTAGVPCSRYKSIAEAMEDPQVKARGVLTTVKDGSGEFKVFNPPFHMRGLNTVVRSHVSELGEDTSQVLTDLLGYSAERVAKAKG